MTRILLEFQIYQETKHNNSLNLKKIQWIDLQNRKDREQYVEILCDEIAGN